MTGSTDLSTASNLPTDLVIHGYRLRRRIGSDAIGLWFDAEQESLGRRLTVKVLKPEYQYHEGARHRFLAEMERLTALDHPHLIQILDTQRGDQPAMVTERIDARTLSRRLGSGKPQGEAASLHYALCVARALAYLQGRGFAHKNISPDLIILREDGGCRLVTFRNIIPIEEQIGLKGKLAQNADYIAPEQLAGKEPVGPSTPCYQIAALLYHMLAGRPPYGDGLPTEIAKAHFTQPFPSLKSAQPFLTRGIYELVAACTLRSPSRRPDLEKVIDALRRIPDGEDPGLRAEPRPAPKDRPRPSAPRSRRRRRRWR